MENCDNKPDHGSSHNTESTNFASALERALQLGVSKEQFQIYWEVEKNMVRCDNKLGHGTSHNTMFPASCLSDPHQLDHHPLRPKTSEDLWSLVQQQIQLRLDRLLDKQIHLWQELSGKWSQGSRQLQQPISNTVKTDLSASKVHVMQESELGQQFVSQQKSTLADLDPDIGAASMQNKMSASDLMAVNRQKIQTPYVSRLCRNSATVNGSPLTQKNSLLDCFENKGYSDLQRDRETKVNKKERREKMGKSLQPHDLAHHGKICSKFCDSGHVVKIKLALKGENTTVLQQPPWVASNSWDETVRSDMIYSDETVYSFRISEQIKDHKSVIQNASAKYSQVYKLGNECSAKFSVLKLSGRLKIENYYLLSRYSTTQYYSSYLNPLLQLWKARFRVTFDEIKEFKVDILVSPGQQVHEGGWPLLFTGAGRVYHGTSDSFTPIWSVEPRVCQQPQGKDGIVLATHICLSTSTSKYQDITVQDLISQEYVDNSMLVFDWDIQCQETEITEPSPQATVDTGGSVLLPSTV